MTLSDDVLGLGARLEAAGLVRELFQDAVLARLRELPEFYDLVAKIQGRGLTPEEMIVVMLRGLAAQRAALAPKIAETSLVATYPGVASISARHTPQVIREMMASAKDEVIVAGFAISRSGGLRDLLVSASQRVSRITVLCSNWTGDDGVEARELISLGWPNAKCIPTIFRYVSPNGGAGMHMKCLIVDSREMLTGSANFTEAGMKRNFELGVYVQGALANAARLLFEEFIRTGVFERVGTPSAI